jgi:hypothetical protein
LVVMFISLLPDNGRDQTEYRLVWYWNPRYGIPRG